MGRYFKPMRRAPSRFSRVDPTDDARQHAHCERIDTHLPMQKQCTQDDAAVVDHRHAGLIQEDFAHLQTSAQATADEKEELCRQDDSRERRTEARAKRVVTESLVRQPDVVRCGDFRQDDARTQHDEHGGHHDGKSTICAFLVLGDEIAIQDSDERDSDCAASEKVAQQIGKLERCAIGILGWAGAEEKVDVLDANQGEQPGEKRAHHQQHGCGARSVAVRGAE